MKQKQKCKHYCIEYLAQRNLKIYFSEKEFDRIYRNGGSYANAYSFGLKAGDVMIRTATPNN